jgi:hypothetical protein
LEGAWANGSDRGEGGAAMTTTHEAIPRFRPDNLDLPTGQQMLTALSKGLEGILFMVDHLAFEHSTATANRGGLPDFAPHVALALEEAMWLVKMYDALDADVNLKRDDTRDGAVT